MGPFGYMVQSSYNLAMAIERVNMTLHALCTGIQVNMTRAGPIGKWTIRSSMQNARARTHDSLVHASILLTLLREFLGQDFRPSKVLISGANPGSQEAFEKCLNTIIEWHGPETQVWFPFSSLAATRVPDPKLQNQKTISVEQAMRYMLNPTPDDLIKTIYALIQFSMCFGYPSLEFVAKHFELSPQALQRRLQQRNLSFSDIAHFAVCNEAIYLMREGLDLEQVAHEVGFASNSAFSRSFKRLHGMTPRKYRQEILRLE